LAQANVFVKGRVFEWGASHNGQSSRAAEGVGQVP
jgi:hypothetical protein